MSKGDQTDAETASKQDPETLVLRGRPRPVVRFRRGLIIGATATVSAAMVAVAWLALEPPAFRTVSQEEPGEPPERVAPDALANAPAGYGDVPVLGPALPGDLGGPILEHRRSLYGDGQPGPSDAAEQAERAAATAEAERQRLAAAEQAARASDVMVELSGAGRAEPQIAEAPLPAAGASAPVTPAATGGQQSRIEFAGSPNEGGGSRGLTAAPSPWTVSAGTIIAASLITGLNSDLPGMVLAQVTEPVWDSVTGRNILVPQGSRLIGSYDSVVAFGQRRALLVWQRIVFPDGSSIHLDNMPATDLSGYAGIEDRVDFHTWRLLKGMMLSTLLGVGTELGRASGESDLVRAIRDSTQQGAARAGDQITQRHLDVQPTLRVRPGWPVRVVVHKDLVLRPWRG